MILVETGAVSRGHLKAQGAGQGPYLPMPNASSNIRTDFST